MRIYVKSIISLVVSVLMAILSYMFPDITLIESVIFGLLVFIILMMISEKHSSAKTLNDLGKFLSITRNFFKEGGSFRDFYNLKLLSTMKDTIHSRNIITELANIPKFWKNTILHFDQSYNATSYIKPSEAWYLKYTASALPLQELKIDERLEIKRVFIVETEEEYNTILPIMIEQQKSKIVVKYIYLHDITNHPNMKTIHLDTYDFALLDREFVMEVFLNDKREIKYAKLSDNSEIFNKYDNFYTILFEEAKDLD